MTFDEFIAKYNGKPVDFDGYYGVQCMDLMHQYVYDVCGLTDKSYLAAPYARNVYENYETISGHQFFDKIPNTPDGVPQKGDIMFWNKTVGEAGHVAIFVEGDVNGFKSFDANWPVGTNPHIQNHNYNGVYVWFRFKAQAPATQPSGIILSDQYDKNAWNNLVNYRRGFPAGADGQEGNIEGFVARLMARDSRFKSLEGDLSSAKKDAEEKDKLLQQQGSQIEELTKKNIELEKQLQIGGQTNIEKDGIIQDKTKENEELSRALTECQSKPTTIVGESDLKKKIYDILYGPGFFLFKYWNIKTLIPKS